MAPEEGAWFNLEFCKQEENEEGKGKRREEDKTRKTYLGMIQLKRRQHSQEGVDRSQVNKREGYTVLCI